MKQLPLPFDQTPQTVVNVASVPHRSPFRYPGGKTWLVPQIRRWMASIGQRRLFIEPFAGGAAVGLAVAFESMADHVLLVEKDDAVAAVWQTALNPDTCARLTDQIRSFSMTAETVDVLLGTPAKNTSHLAFQTIIKNRVNRGGILAPGAGRVKEGENGKGLSSRWYPETLCRRLVDICEMRQRVTFIHGDGLQVLAEYARREDSAVFIDPPYTAGGNRPGARLYLHHTLDHEALLNQATALQSPFLMTYNARPEIEQMAVHHGLQTQTVAMKNTHHAIQSELIISRDLDWIAR